MFILKYDINRILTNFHLLLISIVLFWGLSACLPEKRKEYINNPLSEKQLENLNNLARLYGYARNYPKIVRISS